MPTRNEPLHDKLPLDSPVILYDGACSLCNRTVSFAVKHDHNNVFRIVPLESDFVAAHFAHIVAERKATDSVVLVANGKVYYKSTAILQIMRRLGGFWKAFSLLLVVPPFIRDAIYDLIARNRYRWFGKQPACATSQSVKSDKR